MIARIYDSHHDEVDRKTFKLDTSGNALGEVLDWFHETVGGNEFGSVYECVVVDDDGAVVADFRQ